MGKLWRLCLYTLNKCVSGPQQTIKRLKDRIHVPSKLPFLSILRHCPCHVPSKLLVLSALGHCPGSGPVIWWLKKPLKIDQHMLESFSGNSCLNAEWGIRVTNRLMSGTVHCPFFSQGMDLQHNTWMSAGWHLQGLPNKYITQNEINFMPVHISIFDTPWAHCITFLRIFLRLS